MSKQKKKIMVVDDEQNVRQLVRRILEKSYTVVEAQNGLEAVDTVKTQKPDLILMDMMMPEMDGLSACFVLKQDLETASIPVVMLTAITHELNKKMSENVMGAKGYITKPFTPMELLSTINEILTKEEPSKTIQASAIAG
jgi:two-component system, OmpR family, alkaline phosphatase synthesis response regulator PhoP